MRLVHLSPCRSDVLIAKLNVVGASGIFVDVSWETWETMRSPDYRVYLIYFVWFTVSLDSLLTQACGCSPRPDGLSVAHGDGRVNYSVHLAWTRRFVKCVPDTFRSHVGFAITVLSVQDATQQK